MSYQLSCVGFGEAASTFALAAGWGGAASAYDIDSSRADSMLAAEVTHCAAPEAALADTRLVLSLVTADQALAAAQEYAKHLPAGAIWCDMNSVAPQTKEEAARAVESAGGRYVDVAIMAPVDPAALNVPLLVSGPHSEEAEKALAVLGFKRIDCVGPEIGQASAIKMLRSIIVKGMEALTAECLIAAQSMGLADQALEALGEGWPARADYNLDRMLTHGNRRAAEMEEVSKTLQAAGARCPLSEATARWQRTLGGMGQAGIPAGLAAKLERICHDTGD